MKNTIKIYVITAQFYNEDHEDVIGYADSKISANNVITRDHNKRRPKLSRRHDENDGSMTHSVMLMEPEVMWYRIRPIQIEVAREP